MTLLQQRDDQQSKENDQVTLGVAATGVRTIRLHLRERKKARPYLLKINTGDTMYMYPAAMVCVPARVCHENKSIKY